MRIAVALMALFLSGFSGLLYEVCCLRQAALAFGSTTFPMGTVLAHFFLGIALGSYTFGRIAEHTSRPLRLFALLELGQVFRQAPPCSTRPTSISGPRGDWSLTDCSCSSSRSPF